MANPGMAGEMLCLIDQLSDIIRPAYLAEYFGAWAMQEAPLMAAVENVRQMDLRNHIKSASGESAVANGVHVQDGIAHIQIIGTMMKRASSLEESTSTIWIRRQIRLAANDDLVNGIILHIDSPGGTVAGTEDLAEEVAAAAAIKPVHAYIEDLGASAAYWVASQASSIRANPSALVGSIGTFAVVHDSSKRAKKLGIQVHVIRAGDFKGSGTPGTEVSEQELNEYQRLIDQLNSRFIASVQKGRNIKKIDAVADGRVFIASEALKLGLVDKVQAVESLIAEMHGDDLPNPKRREMMSSRKPRSAEEKERDEETMNPQMPEDEDPESMEDEDDPEMEEEPESEEDEEEPAATLKQLKAACYGADSDFLLAQLEAGASVEQAQKAFILKLQQKKAPLVSSNRAPIGARRGRKTGVSAEERWNEAVAEFVNAGHSKTRAVRMANQANPGLREQFLAEFNERMGR